MRQNADQKVFSPEVLLIPEAPSQYKHTNITDNSISIHFAKALPSNQIVDQMTVMTTITTVTNLPRCAEKKIQSADLVSSVKRLVPGPSSLVALHY